jgi:hypothetical protein
MSVNSYLHLIFLVVDDDDDGDAVDMKRGATRVGEMLVLVQAKLQARAVSMRVYIYVGLWVGEIFGV